MSALRQPSQLLIPVGLPSSSAEGWMAPSLKLGLYKSRSISVSIRYTSGQEKMRENTDANESARKNAADIPIAPPIPPALDYTGEDFDGPSIIKDSRRSDFSMVMGGCRIYRVC